MHANGLDALLAQLLVVGGGGEARQMGGELRLQRGHKRRDAAVRARGRFRVKVRIRF